MGIDETLDLAFNYQRGKLAVFLINYYSYGGGAHGVGGYHYLNVDLETKNYFHLMMFLNQTSKLN